MAGLLRQRLLVSELPPKWPAEQRIRHTPELVLLVDVRARRGARYHRQVRSMLEDTGSP